MAHCVTQVRHIGIGRSWEGYTAVVLDAAGKKLESFTARFNSPEVQAFVDKICRIAASDARSLCAVDTTSGLLGDILLRRGVRLHRVMPQLEDCSGVSSMEPALLAEEAHRAAKPLLQEGGMAQGRGADLLRGIAKGKQAERELERQGALIKRAAATWRCAALTFDDGPCPGVTERVLDILREHAVRATFFCLGSELRSCSTLGHRIAAEGHLLANHSFSHAYLLDVPLPVAAAQITTTHQLITEVAGEAAPYFRPPYGARSGALLQLVARLGLSTVLWDIDPMDWASPPPDILMRRVLDRVRPGSIILLHDGPAGGAGTAKILPQLIKRLRQDGYELVGIDELAR
jgi:peptidoglycan/xylan/chitin deacetylase (PgdA/CDA1 family)